MILNDDIVDIEKPDGICLPAFFMFEFLRLFFPHQFFLLNIHSVKHFWFWVWLNSRILDSSETSEYCKKNYFVRFLFCSKRMKIIKIIEITMISFGIIKKITYFLNLSYVSEGKQDIYIYFFLVYKTLRAIIRLFIKFSNHLFLMSNFFFSYIYLLVV